MTVKKVVGLSGDTIKVYNSMKAIQSNPDALAKELLSWSPDIIFKVLAYDAGKIFTSGSYFLSAGISTLDTQVWTGAASLKLMVERQNLVKEKKITSEQDIKLQILCSKDKSACNKMIIIYKLQYEILHPSPIKPTKSWWQLFSSKVGLN